MRRMLAALALASPLLLCGCESVFEEVYDERYEAECEELRNPDAYRACLNDLEDHRRQREIEDRPS
ncbi:hypothetical protein [Oceanicaulis sp. MMSF_3324]|uniref:hypothetical protein n=1 Tax=Oceanicaulis sp. MMSF_3324 TaxID=3046702 RepID=UPI00273D0CBE|nr:hypothetical protein [Oceanicaulis sp. MMSF_3324]